MNSNEKWLNMLAHLNITPTPNIESGELLKREAENYGEVWRVYLRFEKLLSVDIIKELTSAISNYLITNCGTSRVKYNISYRNEDLDDTLVYDYFLYCVEMLKDFRKSISFLTQYFKKVVNGNIVIEVPNQKTLNLIKDYEVLVLKFFSTYGMPTVKMSVNISDDCIDYENQRIEEYKKIEAMNTASSIEYYEKLTVEAKASEVTSSYKAYKYNGYTDLQIDDIPFTSIEISELNQQNGGNKVSCTGVIVSAEASKIYSKKKGKDLLFFQGNISNYKDTIMIKSFYQERDADVFEKDAKVGKNVQVFGTLQWDDFSKCPCIMINRMNILGVDSSRYRYDGSLEKRVELHAHSKMTVLDSVLNLDEYVAQAKRYGHTALALTDKENVHDLPHFFAACKKAGIKPIAGVEENYIDVDAIKIAYTDEDISLKDATYVVFDLETTGFYINYNEIIEIGAVKVRNGIEIDRFSYFVKPKRRISEFISNLTDITNDMVYDALTINEVLPEFKKFIEGCVLVGHNVAFDADYIYENMRRLGIFEHVYPTIDTIVIAKALYASQGLKKFNLGAVAKFLKVPLEQQHRAIHDAASTNNVFMRMLSDIEALGVSNYKDLNTLIDKNQIYKYAIPTHVSMLVKNKTGLKNMYKMISDANTTHYTKYPRLTREVMEKYRDQILIGSCCGNGEVFKAAMEKTEDILRERIRKYDYIEVQPPSSFYYLFEKVKEEEGKEYIKDVIKLIIRVAKEEGKIVVATGDVHELISEDSEFRKIYLSINRPNGGGPHELNSYESLIDTHFRTTHEMLEEFNFLPAELAKEIVITNTNKIADMIEDYPILPDKLFVPADDFRKDFGVPSMKEEIKKICYENCHNKYGENIPQYVLDRLERELNAIIGHGYFSVYYISHLMVKDSTDHGYVVGSRGSVGSSFVATMMNITEVNPLEAHYVCPNCHFNAFKFNDSEKLKYPQPHVPQYLLDILDKADIGLDLPIEKCPECGTEMSREGINIAFETFLGFKGDKCPDIDLNFSGEYQPQAHLFVQQVFGEDYSFRAGTISTVANKTAFAYVRDYYAGKGIVKRQGELERLAAFLEGGKKTTGQHPGGIVVVPKDIEIYDITPIQYPPVDDKDDLDNMQWRTTHFEYHTFESNLLKLDILGHDDPTMIKKLIGYVHERPQRFPFDTVETIPIVDEDVLSLFCSKDALHLRSSDDDEKIDRFSSGTIGMPEFGTNFVRGMLEDIKPKTYSDIIKVSGLSHGTDVWAGNADLLLLGTVPDLPGVKIDFKNVIGCRDDIMNYLIASGIESSTAFKIMEYVRKGNYVKKPGDWPAFEKVLREGNIPEWFIWTCKKIKYLFPKAHATAYVIMALRIGWFKVHRPIYYYAVYFSVRADELDAEVFANGRNAIRNRILEYKKRQESKDSKDKLTNKEESLLDELYIAYEMTQRGLTFLQIDINKSLAKDFVISEDEKSLYLPFSALDSLGLAAAESIVEARKERPFSSQEDFQRRTKVNKTQFAKLQYLEVFRDLPEKENNTLF